MKSPKPLTLRQAFDLHYLPQHPGITSGTIKTTKYRVNQWERVVGEIPVADITRKHFDDMRASMLKAGSSAASIESLISVARCIIAACVEDGLLPGCPSVGKRLKVRPGAKWTPEISDLSKMYLSVHRTTWPAKRVPAGGWTGAACADTGGWVRSYSTDHWWRTLFCAGYFLGLRHDDLLDLRWDDIKSDRVVRTMFKTQYAVEIPIHSVLQTHLDQMSREDGPVFGRRRKSHKQLARELRLMEQAAGIGRFTLQGLRRLSARSYETARPGAGSCILGHRIRGAAASYLDAFRILSDALSALAVPDAMKPLAEQAQAADPFTFVVSTGWGAPA